MSTADPRTAVSVVEIVRLFAKLRKSIPLDDLVALVGDLSPLPATAAEVDAYVDRIAPHLSAIVKAAWKMRFEAAPAHVVGDAAWAVTCAEAGPAQWAAALDASIEAGDVEAAERGRWLELLEKFAAVAAQILPILIPLLL